MNDNNLTTYGEVNITLDCIIETNLIKLNVKDILINDEDVNVYFKSSHKPISVKSVNQLTEYEQLEINLNEYLLPSDEYVLSIKFHGKIRNVPNGFYRSEYNDTETKEKRYCSRRISTNDGFNMFIRQMDLQYIVLADVRPLRVSVV
jgi:hypothetical protein